MKNYKTKQFHDIGWVIVNNGILLPFTIRSTRKQCMSDYEKNNCELWSILKKQGNIVRKVSILTL